MFTKYIVSVGGGTAVTVVEQNMTTASSDAEPAAGRQVRLIWDDAHNRLLPGTQGLTAHGTLAWDEEVSVEQEVMEESNVGGEE